MSGPRTETCGVPQTHGHSSRAGHWSTLGAYQGRDVTKAGMHGTMDHSLGDALKQLGVSVFSRRGRLPRYGRQCIVCFPPWTEKVVFCKGPDPLSCGGFLPLSQQSPSAEWTLWLTWSICLCVDGRGKLQWMKASHWVTQGGGEHTQHITREHLVGRMCKWCQMIVQR